MKMAAPWAVIGVRFCSTRSSAFSPLRERSLRICNVRMNFCSNCHLFDYSRVLITSQNVYLKRCCKEPLWQQQQQQVLDWHVVGSGRVRTVALVTPEYNYPLFMSKLQHNTIVRTIQTQCSLNSRTGSRPSVQENQTGRAGHHVPQHRTLSSKEKDPRWTSSPQSAFQDSKSKHPKRLKEAFKSKVADFGEDIKTIPNLLTLMRMLSAPVLGYLVLHDHFPSAIVLFICAGITDLMDGYIARNFKNQKTVLGTALDPLADKLLVSVLAITLTMVDLIPVALMVLIVARDAGLVGFAFYLRYLSLPPPRTVVRYFDVTLPTAKLYPSTLSKVNTGIQLSLVTFTLGAPVFDYIGHPYLQALWYLTALTTLSSGMGYVLNTKSFFKILQQKAGHRKHKKS